MNTILPGWTLSKYCGEESNKWMPFDAYLSFQNLKERLLLYVLQNFGGKYDIIS